MGLIKGYGWLSPETMTIDHGTHGMPDIGANQMYYSATESGTIDTMPDIPGLAVWHDGHIGVYIGGGQVIEATITPGEGFSEDGNLVTRDLLYDAATNKQFITVETSGGNTFYIVIDYDKPVDEDGEQYHTYFLNMVDEADLLAALEAAGGELPACSCTEKCAPGAINTDCAVCAVNMTECAGTAPEPAPVTEPAEEPEPEPQQKSNTGTLLLILAVAVLGSGAGWYFKIYRPKHEKAAVPEEDYSEELVDYDDPEDDGPPWDEDDTESEDNE